MSDAAADLPWWAVLGLGVLSVGAAAVLLDAATRERRHHQYSCWNCQGDVAYGVATCPHCDVQFTWPAKSAA